jgi:hypothetical protein
VVREELEQRVRRVEDGHRVLLVDDLDLPDLTQQQLQHLLQLLLVGLDVLVKRTQPLALWVPMVDLLDDHAHVDHTQNLITECLFLVVQQSL